MPELPEVETVMRGLEPVLSGKILMDIKTYRADLRVPFPAGLPALKRRRITGLSRRAKYMLIHFEEDILAVHLGMSGRMVIQTDMAGYARGPHDHMVMIMENGQGVVFNDPRRFGMVLQFRQDDMAAHPSFARLGPEPLSPEFDGAFLYAALRKRNGPVKTVLLDQHMVVGIGNIYACEALFAAGIDPRRKASTIGRAKAEALALAVRDVLQKAIAAGGSSLKDYRQADGSLGYFQHAFKVYDREGEPCPSCPAGGKKKAVIHRVVQAGRSTFFCPVCQK